jgi:hypothetical protein
VGNGRKQDHGIVFWVLTEEVLLVKPKYPQFFIPALFVENPLASFFHYLNSVIILKSYFSSTHELPRSCTAAIRISFSRD